jgi:hypothetical protein
MTTLRQAVNDHCFNCIVDVTEPGTALQQISNCNCSHNCDLWEHRPLTAKLRAIRNEKHLATLSEAERVSVQNRRLKASQNMLKIRSGRSHQLESTSAN